MSQENVEAIRHAFKAFNEGDASVFSDLYDEHVVLHVPPWGIESGVFYGAEDVVRFYRRWFGAFDQAPQLDIEELIEAGDSVIVVHRERVRGRQSGAEVGRLSSSVFTLRAGKIIRIDNLADRESALEAVGLSEVPRSRR